MRATAVLTRPRLIALALFTAGLLALLVWTERGSQGVAVDIRLVWDTSGVERPDGIATITNDLGYTIAVEQFEITTYSVELIPCDEELFRRLQSGDQQQSLSIIGAAWAGHATVHRPTRTATVHVEQPLSPNATAGERLTVPDYRYCAAHYAIARAPQSPAEIAGTTPSKGMSLRLQGRYRRSPAGEWTPFALETPVAHGILIEIGPEPSAAGVDLAHGDAIVVTRRLATVFNGVDFAAMASLEITRQMLRQVVDGSTVAYRGGADALGSAGGAAPAPCPDASFISVKTATRNKAYAAPNLEVSCETDSVVIESNGIPNFDFVQTTPSRLLPQGHRFEIPRAPAVSPEPQAVPLGGPIAVSVGGLPFFGPTEAPVDGWRDPVLDNILDYCGGHTAQRGDYHHHYRPDCLFPDAGQRAGLVLGYAFDGYPILHPYECADAACTSTYKVHSSYEYVGGADAAWESNRYVEGRGQLDRCNGMTRPDGSYAYYATDEFPYFIGCFHGVAAQRNFPRGPGPGRRPPR